MSYWGTSVRVLLFGFIYVAMQVLSATSGDVSFVTYAQQSIYVIGTMLLLDAGYVTIARVRPLSSRLFDLILLLGVMLVLAVLIIMAYLVNMPRELVLSAKMLFVVVLFVICLRLVVGLLFGARVKK